jgi:hypothetical protein
MPLDRVVVDVVLTVAVVAVILFCLYRVVGWARRRQKRAYVVGAALTPFMAAGHVVDPDFRIVHEAKQHKKREEDEPGDPPSENGNALSIAAPPEPSAAKVERILARSFRGGTRATFA